MHPHATSSCEIRAWKHSNYDMRAKTADIMGEPGRNHIKTKMLVLISPGADRVITSPLKLFCVGWLLPWLTESMQQQTMTERAVQEMCALTSVIGGHDHRISKRKTQNGERHSGSPKLTRTLGLTTAVVTAWCELLAPTEIAASLTKLCTDQALARHGTVWITTRGTHKIYICRWKSRSRHLTI